MTDSPGRKSFLLRLPQELYDLVQKEADERNVSVTSYMVMAIATLVNLVEDCSCPDCDSGRFTMEEGNPKCFVCGRMHPDIVPKYRSKKNRVKNNWWQE